MAVTAQVVCVCLTSMCVPIASTTISNASCVWCRTYVFLCMRVVRVGGGGVYVFAGRKVPCIFGILVSSVYMWGWDG